MKHIDIVIVDQNRLFREGVRQLLHRPPFAVLAGGSILAEIPTKTDGGTRPDLIMFGSSSKAEIEAQLGSVRHLQDEPHPPRFVFVTELREQDLLRRALDAGVDAVLSKDISSEVLLLSLELVVLGQRLFPISLVRSVLATNAALPSERQPEMITLCQDLPPPAGSDNPGRSRLPGSAIPEPSQRTALSARENQILRYLVYGFSNKVIARNLHITEATVKVHVKGLLRKVRASNRTQAAIWALQNGSFGDQSSDSVVELPVANLPKHLVSA